MSYSIRKGIGQKRDVEYIYHTKWKESLFPSWNIWTYSLKLFQVMFYDWLVKQSTQSITDHKGLGNHVHSICYIQAGGSDFVLFVCLMLEDPDDDEAKCCCFGNNDYL
jgi:hypothetical protein